MSPNYPPTWYGPRHPGEAYCIPAPNLSRMDLHQMPRRTLPAQGGPCHGCMVLDREEFSWMVPLPGPLRRYTTVRKDTYTRVTVVKNEETTVPPHHSVITAHHAWKTRTFLRRVWDRLRAASPPPRPTEVTLKRVLNAEALVWDWDPYSHIPVSKDIEPLLTYDDPKWHCTVVRTVGDIP